MREYVKAGLPGHVGRIFPVIRRTGAGLPVVVLPGWGSVVLQEATEPASEDAWKAQEEANALPKLRRNLRVNISDAADDENGDQARNAACVVWLIEQGYVVTPTLKHG